MNEVKKKKKKGKNNWGSWNAVYNWSSMISKFCCSIIFFCTVMLHQLTLQWSVCNQPKYFNEFVIFFFSKKKGLVSKSARQMEETRESRAPRASVQSLRRIRKCWIQFEFQLQRCHSSASVRRIVARQFGFRPSADWSALGGRPTSASVRRPFPSAFLRGQSPPPPPARQCERQ